MQFMGQLTSELSREHSFEEEHRKPTFYRRP